MAAELLVQHLLIYFGIPGRRLFVVQGLFCVVGIPGATCSITHNIFSLRDHGYTTAILVYSISDGIIEQSIGLRTD